MKSHSETYSIINDDYAAVKCHDGTHFYYGYEVTLGGDENGDGEEWCFQATDSRGNTITYAASVLDPEANMMGDMAQMLLLGISRLVDEKRLILQ